MDLHLISIKPVEKVFQPFHLFCLCIFTLMHAIILHGVIFFLIFHLFTSNISKPGIVLSHQEYSREACVRTSDCGHLCGGLKGETTCLPCLHGCSNNPSLKQDADDMCMICFSEALSAAPAIQVCTVVDFWDRFSGEYLPHDRKMMKAYCLSNFIIIEE